MSGRSKSRPICDMGEAGTRRPSTPPRAPRDARRAPPVAVDPRVDPRELARFSRSLEADAARCDRADARRLAAAAARVPAKASRSGGIGQARGPCAADSSVDKRRRRVRGKRPDPFPPSAVDEEEDEAVRGRKRNREPQGNRKRKTQRPDTAYRRARYILPTLRSLPASHSPEARRSRSAQNAVAG